MSQLQQQFDRVDTRITGFMARHGLTFLRLSVGIVFLWFGVLKLFPGLSPAADLAARTIEQLTFGVVGPAVSVPLLGAWEAVIGLGLLTGIALRATLLLLFLQMAGTTPPLLFFPAEVFTVFPYAPTLEGQYILKNVVLISAAVVIGATVPAGTPGRRTGASRRGGRRGASCSRRDRASVGNRFRVHWRASPPIRGGALTGASHGRRARASRVGRTRRRVRTRSRGPAVQPDLGAARTQPGARPTRTTRCSTAARASRFHWGEVGEPVNRVRGEWQCSRVYAVLGRAEPALWHARRCLGTLRRARDRRLRPRLRLRGACPGERRGGGPRGGRQLRRARPCRR